MTPEGKEAIRQELLGYILGTAAEWMNLVDLHVDPVTGRVTPEDDHQYRTSWEFPTDDAAVITVKEIDHTEVTRFGITIDVKAIHAGAYGACPDYGSTLDPCPPGCASGTCVANLPRTEWLPATFADLRTGDRVRLGQEETTVRDTNVLLWHTRNREWTDDAGKTRDHQTPWEHTVLRMDLEANPGMHEYPAGTACEILCDAERKAALLLQQGFPGSSVVSS